MAEGLNESLSSLVAQDQSERNEYKNFVKSQAGGDWSKGAKMYAQLKKRPSNDIFGDASRLNQFMKMQFDFDKSIKGDLEVTARGTESLMANEVRSQRLMQFLQIASSPALMPFAKFPYIIREIAKSMDLDPDKVTNNMDEALRQALLMQQATAPAAPAEGAPPVGGPEGGPPPVSDMTGGGGGNIGVGAAPVPGEQGFAGNVQAVPPQA